MIKYGSRVLLHTSPGVWELKQMLPGRGASDLAPPPKKSTQEFVCFLRYIFLLPVDGCLLPGKLWQWKRSQRTERGLV